MTALWRQLGLWPAAFDRVAWPTFRLPNPFERLRIIDAVIIAAGAMLLLKGITLLTDDFWSSAPASAPTEAPGEVPAFARVLARARTNAPGSEVAMTGTVPPKADEPAPKPAAPKPAAPDPKPAASAPEPAAKADPLQASSPSERALLERLGERRDELQQRGRDMEMRERLLENIERKLDARLNELRAGEGKGPDGRRGEPDPGLRNLVTMYETMKPKEAARVFDRLSLDILVPLVQAMNPRKMAEVLALMTPEAAGKLTAALAKPGRGSEPRVSGAAAPLPANELPAIEAGARGR